ncbi:hypothetical protein [Sphingomonas daechungensis]|uniref:hypothetical protein n=1 Tax=Sphingomonas daechungensis TaxID=1176646 RepID=UPI003784BC74
MSALHKLRAASPEVREAALALMDELSAPMDPRSIEKALCRAGFSRSKARPIVMALKRLPIIAIGS